MIQLVPGLWHWAGRHPEWHTRHEFGHVVGSYAAHVGEETLLVDPLVQPDDGVLDALDEIVAGQISILITIPYHVRSAQALAERYDALIWGHRAVQKRPVDAMRFVEIVPGEPLPGGASAFAIGSPRRHEMPLYLPSHDALVFGDAVVFADGALRVWLQSPLKPSTASWYETKLRPTLEPLHEVGAERVLTTHGPPVLTAGHEALAAALAGGPWYHPPR